MPTLVAANDDVHNLFIIDASVFVTSGGLNPAATIETIAFRVCDHMVAEASGATSYKDYQEKFAESELPNVYLKPSVALRMGEVDSLGVYCQPY